MSEESARKINPFSVIRAGEDSTDADGELTFADFRPKVLPADTPDEKPVELPVPKDVSAPEPVHSEAEDSNQNSEQLTLDINVQTPASGASGSTPTSAKKTGDSANSSQTSSSDKKSG